MRFQRLSWGATASVFFAGLACSTTDSQRTPPPSAPPAPSASLRPSWRPAPSPEVVPPAPPVIAAPAWASPLSHGDCYAGCPESREAIASARLLKKDFFTIGYSEERRNPLWVCYRIEKAVDLTSYRRPSRFKTDAETNARVTHNDYTNSGYSRGHMAPKFAISSRYGQAAGESTFIMSNICPQFQSFNDGQWGNLEEWVAGRSTGAGFIAGWADQYEEVWVTVGPIFDETPSALPSGVQVPSAFYCLVLDEDDQGPRILAFVMDHVDIRIAGLVQFLTSVDGVEARTRLDFFRDLPDDLENRLESETPTQLWSLPVNPN